MVSEPGAYLGGGHCPPPFGSLGLQNCIVKWAKLRHGPPLCKLGIRLSGFWLEIWVSSGEKRDGPWVKTFFFFFALHLNLAEKWDEIWVKTFFFCSSPKFGRKMGRNLSEDLFFFALHLNLAEKWDEIWVKTFFFCSSPKFGQKLGRNLSEDLFFLLFT